MAVSKRKLALAMAALPPLGALLWAVLRTETGGKEPPPRAESSDGVTQTPSAGTPPSAPKSCHDLELTAVAVMPRLMSTNCPMASGGRVSDGVYDSIAFEVYGPIPKDARRPFRQTLRVDGQGRRLSIVRPSLRGGNDVLTFGLEVEGNVMNLSGQCPDSIDGRYLELNYSFSHRTLTVHGVRTDGIETLTVYQRRELEVESPTKASPATSSGT